MSSYKFQKAKQTRSLLCLFQSLLKTHYTPPLGSDGPSFNVSWAFNAFLYQRRGFAYDTAGSWGGEAGSGHPGMPVPVIRGAGMWEAEPVTRRHQAEPVLLTVSKQLILKDQRLALFSSSNSYSFPVSQRHQFSEEAISNNPPCNISLASEPVRFKICVWMCTWH